MCSKKTGYKLGIPHFKLSISSCSLPISWRFPQVKEWVVLEATAGYLLRCKQNLIQISLELYHLLSLSQVISWIDTERDPLIAWIHHPTLKTLRVKNDVAISWKHFDKPKKLWSFQSLRSGSHVQCTSIFNDLLSKNVKMVMFHSYAAFFPRETKCHPFPLQCTAAFHSKPVGYSPMPFPWIPPWPSGMHSSHATTCQVA